MTRRFVLVHCKGREEEFPDHIQWRATCGPSNIDVFFWLRREDGIDGAKDFIRRQYPAAAFSDEALDAPN